MLFSVKGIIGGEKQAACFRRRCTLNNRETSASRQIFKYICTIESIRRVYERISIFLAARTTMTLLFVAIEFSITHLNAKQ